METPKNTTERAPLQAKKAALPTSDHELTSQQSRSHINKSSHKASARTPGSASSYSSLSRLRKESVAGYKYISKAAAADDDETAKKRFLFRLLYELQTSGNFGYRTEKYIHRIGRTYNLYVVCGVYPRTATVTFQHDHSESYTFELSGGYHFHKLELLDELCNDIYVKKLPFKDALIRLSAIEKTKSYRWEANLLASAVASFTSTVMFFGGTWLDGMWGCFMGVIVFCISQVCSRYSGLSEIEVFISAFICAFIASLLDLYVYNDNLCLYGVLFGGVVWLLPGVTITVSLIELYSKMITFGATKLVYSISVASQIGFGLTIGYKIAKNTNEIPWSFVHGCREPVPVQFDFLLLPICAISFSTMLNGSYRQHLGVVLICGVGQLVSVILSDKNVGPDAVPFIAAISVTACARIYAGYMGVRPLVYIISGLLVLVPGGVAVRGMSSIWQDASTGLEFTTKMLLIGVSLAIGVFVSLLPPFQAIDKTDNDDMSHIITDPEFDIENAMPTLNPIKDDVDNDANYKSDGNSNVDSNCYSNSDNYNNNSSSSTNGSSDGNRNNRYGKISSK